MSTKSDLSRRFLLQSGVATAATLAAPASALAQALPPAGAIDPAWAQPMLAQARRVIAALQALGEPLAAAEIAAIDALERAGDLGGAAALAAQLFDRRTLLAAAVTPEARVSVRQGAAQPLLVQSGWRVFLVRIDNPAMVPGTLGMNSPQAKPLNNRYPVGHAHSAHLPVAESAPVTPGDMAQRWLEIAVQDAAPLFAALDPVPIDYRIISLYARDAGRRAAQLHLDIGPMTGDIGNRAYAEVVFTIAPAGMVALSVRDADGTPTVCSLLIRDSQARILPAQTKRALPDLYFQPQIYRRDGQTLMLTPGTYSVEIARGPEYIPQRATRVVYADRQNAWPIKLQRWIDPREHKYYSGDHHVHASGCAHFTVPEEGVIPAVMQPQVEGEGLSIGSVLTWGPGFYHQKRNFRGTDDPVSKPGTLLHYDLEVSGFPSSHCGHLVFLQMQSMDYPGTSKIEEWPSSNTPVLEWARSENAVTGYTHSGWGLWADTTDLPNYKMPAFDGIGANDYIVTVTAGLVDLISTISTMPAAELNIWYHTLNAGYRTRISGETDWPCIYDEAVGLGRSYVKLEGGLNYADWCQGLKRGTNYVSEGRAHLMDFTARAGKQMARMGEGDIVLAAPEPVQFEALVAARLEPEPTPATERIRNLPALDKPFWHLERARVGAARKVVLELLVNGVPVESRIIEADGIKRAQRFSYTPSESCWVALRIAHGAHTNPIWLTLADQPLRVARSIAWCRAAVDQCWSQKSLRIRPGELPAEQARYDAARAIYDARLREAKG